VHIALCTLRNAVVQWPPATAHASPVQQYADTDLLFCCAFFALLHPSYWQRRKTENQASHAMRPYLVCCGSEDSNWSALKPERASRCRNADSDPHFCWKGWCWCWMLSALRSFCFRSFARGGQVPRADDAEVHRHESGRRGGVGRSLVLRPVAEFCGRPLGSGSSS